MKQKNKGLFGDVTDKERKGSAINTNWEAKKH